MVSGQGGRRLQDGDAKNGELRAGVMEMLEKENDVKIAKLSWLIWKDSSKAYGPMVVYVTKRADAARLLEGKYFNADGKSASARVFGRDVDRCGASSVWGSVTWLLRGRSHRRVAAVLSQDTITVIVKQPASGVWYAADRASRPVASVGPSRRLMPKPVRTLQLNLQKQRSVYQGMMNDVTLRKTMRL